MIFINSIWDTMENIQEKIFSYNVQEAGNLLADLVEQLSALLPGLEKAKLDVLDEILTYVNTGMQNKDYLLVADFLRYELEPFIRSNLN